MKVTKGEWMRGGWGGQGETRLCMVNTQCNIQMMYHKIVPLKHIVLLTNVTPICLIKKIEFIYAFAWFDNTFLLVTE